MPGIYGPDFVRIVRRYNDRLPIVLLSGDGQATLIEAATECGACAAVHKGELDTLVPVVERLLASVQDLPMTG